MTKSWCMWCVLQFFIREQYVTSNGEHYDVEKCKGKSKKTPDPPYKKEKKTTNKNIKIVELKVLVPKSLENELSFNL